MPGLPARAMLVVSPLYLVALIAWPLSLTAQQPARVALELHLDATGVRAVDEGALQAGVGIGVPLGLYARAAIVGAGGVTRQQEREVGSGRIDVVARVLLDPFREARWGISVGGGVSVDHAAGANWRQLLLLLLDIEGPPMRRYVVPAMQVGVGGGLRVGLVARRYQQGRR